MEQLSKSTTSIILFVASFGYGASISLFFGADLVPDSSGYLRVASNYAQFGSLLENDYIEGCFTPFTERMPGYPFVLSLVEGVEGVSDKFLNKAVLINVFFHSISVVLVFLIGFNIFNYSVGVLAGVFMLIDPWALLVVKMVLPDTIFNFSATLIFFIGSLVFREGKSKLLEKDLSHYFIFVVYGVVIGGAIMVKPTLNYYWIVLLILFFLAYPFKIALPSFVITLLILSLILFTWANRNYSMTGYYNLQTTTGVSLLWSNKSLTSKSSEKDYIHDPILAGIRDHVVSAEDSVSVVTPIRREYALSRAQVDSYLTKIAFENIFDSPVEFLHIYKKNVLKTVSSFFSYDENGNDSQIYHKIIIELESIASLFCFLLLPLISIVVIIRYDMIGYPFVYFFILNIE